MPLLYTLRKKRHPNSMDAASFQWLDTVCGPYALLCQTEGMLLPGAETILCGAVRETGAPLLYADAAIRTGKDELPLYKPDFAPDTLLRQNYVGSPLLLSKTLLLSLGCAPERMNADEQFALTLRAMLNAAQTVHVPHVLFAGGPPPAPRSVHPVETALLRLGRRGIAALGDVNDRFAIRYALERKARVSVIVRSYGDPNALRRTLESVELCAGETEYETIVAAGGIIQTAAEQYYRALERHGAARVVRCPGEENDARLKNIAAGCASGAYLLVMDAGTVAKTPNTLLQFLLEAQNSGAGVIAGWVEDERGLRHSSELTVDAQDIPRPVRAEEETFANAGCTHNATLLGGAIFVSAETFGAAGGFDETFDSCWCETALSLTLAQRGRRNVVTPDVCFQKTSAVVRPLSRRNRERCGDMFRALRVQGDPMRSQNPEYLAAIRSKTGDAEKGQKIENYA